MQGRDIQALGRTVTATAGSLIAPFSETHPHYQSAMTEIARELQQPTLQQRVLSLSARTPSEIMRSKLSTTEIQHRAVTYLPDELLVDIPDSSNTYSLFQGFQASLPEKSKKKGRKARSNNRALPDIQGSSSETEDPPTLSGLEQDRADLTKHLEMLSIRKNMCSAEIRDIDMKISNYNAMRGIVLQRLANLELEEGQTEHESLYTEQRAQP